MEKLDDPIVMSKYNYNAIKNELYSLYRAIEMGQNYLTIFSYWDKDDIDVIFEEIEKNNTKK